MPKGPFLPSDFAPSQFSTAADKANFGNALLHFMESEWKQELFTKSLYNRLSMCFGHIAHYNREGFYETWFTSDQARLRFLQHSLKYPCWGSPEYTFCDVERAVQREIRQRNYLARYELKAAEAVRSAELAILERLETKYRREVFEVPVEQTEVASPATHEPRPAASTEVPVQASLF
jgi:hypothetical protein